VWEARLPVEAVAGIWRLSVLSAFRFGAGVPVRVAGRPLGLLVEPPPALGAPVLVDWADVAEVRKAGAGRGTGLRSSAIVEIELVGGGVLPFTTRDPSGLADLVARHCGDRPGTQSG
jgi:hypothetical protein